MINLRSASWYSVGVFLAVTFQLAGAAESGIRMIVLTDKADKSLSATAEMDRSMHPGTRATIRQQLLKEIEEQRLEMHVNGFVVGSDVTLSNKDAYPDEIIKHQSVTGNSYDSVLPDLGYSARNLTDSAFNKKGRLLGFMPVRSHDNKIHEAVWAYAVPGIGRVIVEELSYRTIPDVTITVAEPSGNIQINGNSGTYMVMTDETGKRGVTTIDFMTSDKLFTITAYKAIKRDNKRFKTLLQLAESLF